ncbi:hypothetical protein BH09DEP1_BH09DEP1_6430 [soil metagenome]
MNKKRIDLILENAAKIQKLYDAVESTAKNKKTAPKPWQKATEAFHKAYDILAFPGGLEHSLPLLKKQDPQSIQSAIEFLQADPYFHRSGSIKEKVASALKQISLSPEQIEELQAVMLAAIEVEGRGEFLEYCRLARKLSDKLFVQQLEKIIKAPTSAGALQRATQMMQIIK